MNTDDVQINRWNMDTGQVHTVCRIRDCHL